MVSHLDQGSRVTLLLISCDEMAPALPEILDAVIGSPERYPAAWKYVCKRLRNSIVGAALASGCFFLGNVVGAQVGGLFGGVAGVVLGVLSQEDGVEQLRTTIIKDTLCFFSHVVT